MVSAKTKRNYRWLARNPGYYAKWNVAHPGYSSWKAMVQRCCNQNAPNWAEYGGRGIRLHPEWRVSYQAFIEHIGKPPSKDLSIDRIDTDGHYVPGNVRWATRSEQQRNKRSGVTEQMKNYLREGQARGDSWQRIADTMNANGVLTPRGRVWSRQNAKDCFVRQARADLPHTQVH